jgi:hypothetical protein
MVSHAESPRLVRTESNKRHERERVRAADQDEEESAKEIRHLSRLRYNGFCLKISRAK